MPGLWKSLHDWWTGARREGQQPWRDWRPSLADSPSCTALLQHAAAAGDRSRPTVAWRRATPTIDEVTPLCRTLDAVDLTGWRSRTEQGLPEEDTLLLRGLVWALGEHDAPAVAPVLGRLAERSFRKIPGVGPANLRLGNAALLALSRQPVEHGVAELTRLSTTLRYPSARDRVETMLAEVGERTGIDEDVLRELGPTFDLDERGCRDEPLGDYTARLFLTSDGARLGFVNRKGKLLEGTPKQVRLHHGTRYAALLDERRALQAQLEGHRRRLQRCWLRTDPLPWDRFVVHYLEHPVVGFLTQRLLWEIEGTLVLWHQGAMRGLDGAPRRGPVHLWHPLPPRVPLPTDQRPLWNDRLEELGLSLALPQLERADPPPLPVGETIDQRKLLDRCQRRGWSYTLQGAFANEDDPSLTLPGLDLVVLLQVEPEPALSGGIYDRVVVRGLDVWQADETLAFDGLPALVRAEILFEVAQLLG